MAAGRVLLSSRLASSSFADCRESRNRVAEEAEAAEAEGKAVRMEDAEALGRFAAWQNVE